MGIKNRKYSQELFRYFISLSVSDNRNHEWPFVVRYLGKRTLATSFIY